MQQHTHSSRNKNDNKRRQCRCRCCCSTHLCRSTLRRRCDSQRRSRSEGLHAGTYTHEHYTSASEIVDDVRLRTDANGDVIVKVVAGGEVVNRQRHGQWRCACVRQPPRQRCSGGHCHLASQVPTGRVAHVGEPPRIDVVIGQVVRAAVAVVVGRCHGDGIARVVVLVVPLAAPPAAVIPGTEVARRRQTTVESERSGGQDAERCTAIG